MRGCKKRPGGWRVRAAWVVGSLVLAACVGCGRSDAPQEKAKPPAPGPATAQDAQGTAAEPSASVPSATAAAQPKEPPAPPTIPKVTMSEADRATCRVGEGDLLPDAELPDLDGKTHALRSLWGERLTVVVLWDGANLYALEALEDLDAEVHKPYGEKGVRVIGVAVRQTPQAVRDKLQAVVATFPMLLDADGAYLAKLATQRLPRTYLLDAEGKILWFDIEYSRHTRRSLMQGIRVALGEMK
jgi:peroxiredoxin